MPQSGNISLDINLRPIPEFKDEIHVGSGDFLEIYSIGDSPHYNQELNFVVNQRSLSYSSTSTQEFHETLDIGGKLYRNIFTENNAFIFPKIYTFYYNKIDGLVAFRDDNDVVWHLVN